MSSDSIGRASGPFPVLGGERAAGVLLHLTSLPGPHGVGDVGTEAERFLDWLVDHGQRVWQTLPVTAAGSHASPYDCRSSCAAEPLLISPNRLVDDGLIPPDRLRDAPGSVGSGGSVSSGADLGAASAWKSTLIDEAWRRFRERSQTRLAEDLTAFVDRPTTRQWLDEWTLFAALADEHGADWSRWPEPLRRRDDAALAAARERLADRIDRHRFGQWLFSRQWSELRRAATVRGVLLMGDIPFYVARHSADVWSRPELFAVDRDGRLVRQSGVPPDAFSESGQLWGNPVFDWEAMAEEGYRWWIRRLAIALDRFDLVRIDHFRGFVAHWEVPAEHQDAVDGGWRPGPGRRLFDAASEALGDRLPLVAEDLGTITPEVEALRRELGLPGMRVLQFAFDDPDPGSDDDGDEVNPHLPRRHEPLSVVYTGTHDNPPTRAWIASLDERRRERLARSLGGISAEPHRDLVRLAYRSVARLAVVPMQDVLGLGAEARMNTPGEATGNWCWRLLPAQLEAADTAWLRQFAADSDRL